MCKASVIPTFTTPCDTSYMHIYINGQRDTQNIHGEAYCFIGPENIYIARQKNLGECFTWKLHNNREQKQNMPKQWTFEGKKTANMDFIFWNNS